MPEQVEVAIVGGGVGGAALATALGRAGRSVVVFERSRVYEDRVRGEWIAPWGVVEARALGVYDDIVAAGGHHLSRHVTYDETVDPAQAEKTPLPLNLFRPDVPGPLCIGHPHLCQTLIEAADAAGARVLRGVRDVSITTGSAPAVHFRHAGEPAELRCRLIVGADGRTSSVRRAAGIPLHRDPPHHLFAGLLVEDADGWPEDLQAIGTEGDFAFLAFPQGRGRVRIYGGYPLDQRGRFAGDHGTRAFLAAFRLVCCPEAEHLADGRAAGPCLSYANQDTWTENPCAPGLVLIGDAAGYNDPIIGQGLSITLRDARSVCEVLLGDDDWTEEAFRPYAEERAERMRRLRFAAALMSRMDCEFGSAPAARRKRFFESMQTDPSLGVALAASLAGPEMLPAEAFSEQTWDRVVGL